MFDLITKTAAEPASYAGMAANWHHWAPGGGRIAADGRQISLSLEDAGADRYADAQLDDYGADGALRWSPPLALSVRARLGADGGAPRGTAGFGFWNDPGGTVRRRLAPPRAAWFFYASPPSDIALDSLVAGHGWKAMTIDASRPPFLALLPFAPLAIPLMWQPWLRRALWPIGQWALGVREAPVRAPMGDWHGYRLEWRRDRVTFYVNGDELLASAFAPRGPLGLVLWIDNQYAIVTPGGRLGGGLLAAPGRQWLELRELRVEPLAD